MHSDAIALFRELADCSPLERQEYYVREGVPAALRADVESLLRFDGDTGGDIHGRVAAAASLAFGARIDSSRGSGDIPASDGLSSTSGGSAKPRFPCGGRFTMRRQLGAGGMGVVYEVEDRARNEIVALKTLIRTAPAGIYRLKREFRSLADIAHTNLVSLYELVVDEVDCFFTMELVRGVNVVEYVRGLPLPARADATRHVLRQLVDGIETLHRRGKLHRDIKPSNVLVTEDRRVVILDFGLTSDVYSHDDTIGERMAGTPAYLSPERRAGAVPCKLHDWYSVGVTLHEMLTGRRAAADTFEPAFPEDVEFGAATQLPKDLKAICAGLLRRDPAARLSGSEVLQLLRPSEAVSQTSVSPSDEDAGTVFVGRSRQFEVLEGALRATRDEVSRTIFVYGPSGIGKSTLVRCFLDRVGRREDPVVLRGRCYEHESVPYKALDGIIDSLSQYLARLPRRRTESLLPPEAGALSRLFPVLRQVPAIASIASRPAADEPPVSVRRRAIGALQALLANIAAAQPLIAWIDDLQWADADSAVLLQELFQAPVAPPILTIACFRSEEIPSKPFLRTLLERADSNTVTALPLDPMNDEDAHALLASVGLARGAMAANTLTHITREAHGNPFLLRQLATYLSTHHGTANAATFAEMMAERLRVLPAESQRFLEMLSICGRPMSPEIVHDAAGLEGDERWRVAHLRTARFLRSSGSAERVELYHDRIREDIAARVPPEHRRAFQRQLARALVVRGVDDPDALYELHREAGEPAEATRYAILAARKAEAALAFDRTSGYYRAALELTPDSPECVEWTVRLASALAYAGRPAAAAEAYLQAAAAVPGTRGMELQRAAAEQLLIGGHIDRGLEVLRVVLRAVRMRLAMGPRSALTSLLWHRLRLRWRGLQFTSRPAHDVPAAELLRIDTCWSVAAGLAFVDNIRGVDFHTRHLLLALKSGEPYRIARALAFETAVIGIAGGARRAQVLECSARAEAMADSLGDRHAIALSTLTKGISALLVGEWRTAHACCERALRMLRDQSVGTIMELNAAQAFSLGALLFQGELRMVSNELPALLADARERGNLHLETEIRTRMNLVWLAADQPDDAERQANEAMRCWSHAGFHRQHYNHMLARIQTELYRGRAEAAWQAIGESWQAVRRSLLFRIQWVRIEAWYLRARCALMMAVSGRDARRFITLARRDALRIAGEKMPWSTPLSGLISAAVAHVEHAPDIACAELAQAAAGFERAHMKLYASVAHRRLGEIARDAGWQERRREADEWMAAQGIVRPDLITRLIAPGFIDR